MLDKGLPRGIIAVCAPVAQGIERLPPEQKAARSNRAGCAIFSYEVCAAE
jgi:hypothetical protein